MKLRTKQCLSLVLVLVLAATILGGCSTAAQTTTAPSTAPSSAAATSTTEASAPATATGAQSAGLPDMPTILREDPEQLEYMTDISPITINIFYAGVSTEPWTWGNAVEKKITELTGVTLKGTYSADAQGNALTLMIASGDKLPDIINGVGASSVQMQEMIKGDCLYPINKLIDQYCPLMWSLMDPISTSKADADGNLWYLVRGVVTSKCINNYPIANGWFAVRQDIVEALGNPSLKTIDDMWAFLKLWEKNKDKWPEIKCPINVPALASKTGNGRPFYNSFGGHLSYSGGLDMIYDKTSNSVHYWIEDDYGYKAVKEMFKLAQAGYITQESFGLGDVNEAFKAGSMLLYTGQNVWQCSVYNPDLAKNVPGASYTRIAPISYSSDHRVTYGDVSGSDWNLGLVVPKDCVNPERTIKFLEFLQTEYAGALVFFGIYGEHFTLETRDAAKGTVYPKYIGAAAEGSAKRAELGIYLSNKLWLNTYSDYDIVGCGELLVSSPDMAVATDYWENDYYEYVPMSAMNSVAPDAQEAILRGKLEEMIGNYQTRMILAKDEAEFDVLYKELIKNLEDNGLQTLKDFVLPLCNDIIKTKGTQGVVFH